MAVNYGEYFYDLRDTGTKLFIHFYEAPGAPPSDEPKSFSWIYEFASPERMWLLDAPDAFPFWPAYPEYEMRY